MASKIKSDFAKLQEDVCEIPEEAIEDKICPSCILNPNYVEPTWWLQTEPYLNERTCEYSISVSINEQGEFYTPALFRQRNVTVKQVLRSFVRPAVRKILTFYGKQISDEIVCAIPPTGNRLSCRSLVDLDIDESIISNYLNVTRAYTEDNNLFDTHELDLSIQRAYPEIKNLNAVELYARATDYHFGTKTTMPMKVLVTIPAHIVDAIPDALEEPDAGPASYDIDSVIIKGDDAEEICFP